jgi:hypothetical protein
MKPLDKDELFQNLSGFLKAKGIELKDGSYADGIRKSCGLLSEAINLGQKGVGKAKAEIDAKLDQVRQAIHECTAPKTPPAPAAAPPTPVEPEPKPADGPTKPKAKAARKKVAKSEDRKRK